ncbi:MAG: penicillin-binding protein activator [Rickettsiales bacterium]|nr:penicillin-binding protein activator [Rickettsiales bacterium]
MFIKKLSAPCALCLAMLVGACAPQAGWHGEYGEAPASRPVQMQSDFYYPEYGLYGRGDATDVVAPTSDLKNVAVLLPLSGPNATVGDGINASVEMAFLQRKHDNISVTFHDLSGNKSQKQGVITSALAANPDIVIGPVFAEDAALLRDMKPQSLPVLSFTSDVSAIGDGVMTMALIPSQSVEIIVKEMTADNISGIIVMAPDTASGARMAGAAVQSANIYDMPVAGVFYYAEGDSDSIKRAAQKASMHRARTAANTKAREILADILNRETLTAVEKSSLNAQLDKLGKSDTLGGVPYDAVLFLGNAGDTKAIASFLRYFDVAPRDAGFYGTALWDGTELLNDFSFVGAKYAALGPQSADFSKLYEQVWGRKPSRLDTFGFDAANMAIGMLHSSRAPAAYLLDPGGYNGLDGLFRLRPTGESERALQILEITGGGAARLVRAPRTDFLIPIYSAAPGQISGANEMELTGPGVNPMKYIRIPERLRGKYASKTFGANMAATAPMAPAADSVVILPEDDSDVIESTEFQPAALEHIDRTLIDSVEVNE